MNSFDYGAYASSIQSILSAQGRLQENLAEIKKKLDSAEAKENAETNGLINQLANTRKACLNQYAGIRESLESVGVRVLPVQQRPLPSQLVVEDAVASQNKLATDIHALIDQHHRDVLQEQKQQRAKQEAEQARQAAEARAQAQARELAAIEAKKKEEERIKAEMQAALQRQLAEEKEKQQREELKKRLEKLIPAGVILAIILLILLLKH